MSTALLPFHNNRRPRRARSRPLHAAVLAAAVQALPAAGEDRPFSNDVLIALSDGAMVASGYIDGALGPRRPDVLSVLRPRPDGTWRRADIAVSNSVATFPSVLAITPDGRFAIVTEPFAQPTEEARLRADVPEGRLLTVVDITDPGRPTIVQRLDGTSASSAVDVHPSGDRVAVTRPFADEIAIHDFANGRLGVPDVFPLGLDDVARGTPLEIAWHPSGDFVAVTLASAAKVAFYRHVDGELKPWGEPVQTAPLPGKGAWTRDGRHFIVTTINATPDMAQASYARNASLLAVFAFDDDDVAGSAPRRADDGEPQPTSEPVQHARVAYVPAGMGYVENFALSPDGRHLVGLNMAASWLPEGHPGRTSYSELTLFAFDERTGALDPLGATRMDSVVLPQGIAFDSTGEHLVVSSFQTSDGGAGRIDAWKLDDARTALLPTEISVPMPRGVHSRTAVP